jgi:hypothetical protein
LFLQVLGSAKTKDIEPAKQGAERVNRVDVPENFNYRYSGLLNSREVCIYKPVCFKNLAQVLCNHCLKKPMVVIA